MDIIHSPYGITNPSFLDHLDRLTFYFLLFEALPNRVMTPVHLILVTKYIEFIQFMKHGQELMIYYFHP